jgi:ubiquinone/menaquinone biosynthesis C-methylase UbiE
MDMNLSEATSLIKPGFPILKSGTWCDLGCGSGLFTNALASLLGKESTVHAIDKSLQHIHPAAQDVKIEFHRLDFVTEPLPFSGLDGILMANSLHFVRNKISFLTKLKENLKANGQFVFVEYELSKGNNWVPYPATFDQLCQILTELDVKQVMKIGEADSVYGDQKMYACKGELGK